MKTFKQWLATSTVEVQQLPDMGKKLAYALYKQRMKVLTDPKENCTQGSMIGFNLV